MKKNGSANRDAARALRQSKRHQNGLKSLMLDNGCQIYREEYFHDVLSHERRRTERSGKPFLLMLLDVTTLNSEEAGSAAVRNVTCIVNRITREIDVKGWYRDDAVIGIIFTEFNGTDIAILKDKIITHISESIDTEVLKKIRISCHVYPEGCSVNDSSHTERDTALYPDLTNDAYKKKAAAFLKRFIDIVGSGAGLILFLPLFVLIAITIKLTSPGPIFFRQERVGQFGKRFTFLKFRTMKVNCDDSLHKEYIQELIRNKKGHEVRKNGKKTCVYKIHNDPRVTAIGHFLRKSSLDELPQFVNVLRGDMSIVGPRPPIPYELASYHVWHMRRILEMKPGITGIWQVYGRSITDFDDMVRMDIRYTREWSLLLDLKLIMRTPLAVIAGKGAY